MQILKLVIYEEVRGSEGNYKKCYCYMTFAIYTASVRLHFKGGLPSFHPFFGKTDAMS